MTAALTVIQKSVPSLRSFTAQARAVGRSELAATQDKEHLPSLLTIDAETGLPVPTLRPPEDAAASDCAALLPPTLLASLEEAMAVLAGIMGDRAQAALDSTHAAIESTSMAIESMASATLVSAADAGAAAAAAVTDATTEAETKVANTAVMKSLADADALAQAALEKVGEAASSTLSAVETTMIVPEHVVAASTARGALNEAAADLQKVAAAVTSPKKVEAPEGAAEGAGVAATTESRAAELRLAGQDALACGDAAEAVRLFSEGLKLLPTSHLMLSGRSMAMNQLGRAADAAQDALAVVQGAPSWALGWYRCAVIVEGQGKLVEAADMYACAHKVALEQGDERGADLYEEAKQRVDEALVVRRQNIWLGKAGAAAKPAVAAAAAPEPAPEAQSAAAGRSLDQAD